MNDDNGRIHGRGRHCAVVWMFGLVDKVTGRKEESLGSVNAIEINPSREELSE